MNRVAVLGCGGAGKTTLARELGALLGLPVIHGDALRAEWEHVHDALIARERWIIDAMRINTLDARLERADTAVFLDVPTFRCVWGIARRGDLLVLLRTREFLSWVLRFRRRHRSRLLAALARHAPRTRVYVLRSRRDVRRFLSDIRRVAV